ncbi:hypothetical protein GOBAR_AA17039 [Gossypium barbadense]|uniref:glutamate decarboxylase n=1 Tax=Gossypium barbadense TaxID=3634 RepID=A0A2P5XJU9_GOSBA|nr:hypothetical protein GOBAR_AA17039 [Gossypium barbadense]
MVLSKTASQSDVSVHSTFASRYVRHQLPRFRMPENSIPKDAAYQIINDELMLDGNPRLNLASFVTTWMEPECNKLIMDAINKNYVDMDEYPVTTELQNRCVNMIAHLFNAPLGDSETAVGVGTVGSSEAIMLAGLAFKRKWQNKRKAEGKPYDKPNIVTGANVQVCWEKFARWDTPIHVDAASGGFIAPFLYPELEWDFRLPLVKSINVSGHKYGTRKTCLKNLFSTLTTLELINPTFTLNFSKGSSQVIAQYYQLIRLGYEGYRNIMENCHENAMVLKEGLEKTGRFNIVSKDEGVPLVAFSLKDNKRHDEFEISEMLRRFGWIVPAYTMPADAQHITVLRVVIREDFSRTLAERLVIDIQKVLHELDTLPAKVNAKLAMAEEENSKNGTVKKTAIETQREITSYWKKFVRERKTNKNKIC